MNIRKSLTTLSLACTLMLPSISQADEFKTVQIDKSSLTFGFKQMGVSMDGHFKKFAAQVNFDPAKPANAKAHIELDLASIDVGSDEGNEEVAGKQWFNTKAFPKANFVASGVKAVGGNRYEVSGPLTIKGRTNNVTAPATVTIQGNTATLDGTFVLKRADFAIGEGPWAAFDTVANEIQIKFHLLATTSK